MGEKEENEAVRAKRRCVCSVSAEEFDISVKAKTWRVVLVLLGVTCWRFRMICLTVSLKLGRLCLRCFL